MLERPDGKGGSDPAFAHPEASAMRMYSRIASLTFGREGLYLDSPWEGHGKLGSGFLSAVHNDTQKIRFRQGKDEERPNPPLHNAPYTYSVGIPEGRRLRLRICLGAAREERWRGGARQGRIKA